ncbi:ABC transporter substrate-binding protein [Trichlorobacter lovleyi]|uniref:ABC transporter substrate-binding protein n=1 Tax=Trichlorobacter lovleyi TaxID=313985 RepID=UPI00223FF647|nr:ABC transporter substrate binding protein [Trichlorobacter lovleyi]QOX77800.1 ABC transporter substrate-binding protein [Trichlorobacter lovleyi]
MRRLVLCIVALALLVPSLAQAYDLLVLQSKRSPAYDEVLKGFSERRNVSRRVIVLSDYAEVDVVRIAREDRPTLILAVGDTALAAARKVRTIPVVALMSLDLRRTQAAQPNLTGIDMFVAPENYCNLLHQMKVRRVGIVYNPARSGWYLRQARQAAERAGIVLVAREVTDPRDTLARLASLAGKVDALWMLPDVTAVTRETAEAYFHFSQQQAVPVVSFAANYLGLGAAAVFEIDRAALGRQASEMVTSLLDGEGIESTSLSFPHGVILKTNAGILKRLGASLDE